jgi:hypothetical protein
MSVYTALWDSFKTAKRTAQQEAVPFFSGRLKRHVQSKQKSK